MLKYIVFELSRKEDKKTQKREEKKEEKRKEYQNRQEIKREQETQLSLRDRATRACQLKSGKVLHKCRRLVFEKL